MDQADRENPPQDQGSLAGSDVGLLNPAAPRRSSNSRAFKVAGLTTLACLLLASQVFTAYMVFGQKQQINSLQRDSEKMAKQVTRSSQAASPMRLPIKNMPLMMDLTLDDGEDTTAKTPLSKLHDTAIVSLEKQLTDLLEDSNLPQFNGTFGANLQSLKQHMNGSEWKGLESWLRNWLIFQMAQQKPAAPTSLPASKTKSKCQMEAGPGRFGAYKPKCDEWGRYLPMQCWSSIGFCWCVEVDGTPIAGTNIRGHPDCPPKKALRGRMVAPMLIQEAFDTDGQ
ncbi:CD74 molecule, major histocompatibility complex, class II invariant chain a isoform X1 [Hippoglossus hippoglossus]|uniref:CD74 molecule, major histocompatibility complex, class II invariant chain a isoform X1 n=1 Tax=Hippoglossus hippoglossus TaxID=8267 RepID=UPI00148DB11F|nr:CD74 molecule, major histocompatibility complex, class II invariant chain a isoform X1 [Hippoglossus hippoglossus]